MKDKVKLSIQSCDVSQLASMLPFREFGRFSEIRKQIKIEIAVTPENQYIRIPLKKEQLENRKDISGIINSVRKEIKPLDWTVYLNRMEGAFIVVRNAHLDSARKLNREVVNGVSVRNKKTA